MLPSYQDHIETYESVSESMDELFSLIYSAKTKTKLLHLFSITKETIEEDMAVLRRDLSLCELGMRSPSLFASINKDVDMLNISSSLTFLIEFTLRLDTYIREIRKINSDSFYESGCSVYKI